MRGAGPPHLARARLWRRRGMRVRNVLALLVLLARGRMLRESLVRLLL